MACNSKSKEESIVEKLLRINKPAVMKNMLHTWKNVPQSLEEFSQEYGSTVLQFRVVHIIQPDDREEISLSSFLQENCVTRGSDPLWEGDAQCVRTSLKNFVDWANGNISPNSIHNPLNIYEREDYWMYSSYNHMHKYFPAKSEIMKGIDWSSFGLQGRKGDKSTVWIGSNSSYTPFHMDTYGYNLVAQVVGKKKWVLFPPHDSDFLYMTRIPYEESSIFGQVNIFNPDLRTRRLFQYTHPHVVTLEPGDVLFVPPKWWHYVTSLTDSISINTWVEIESDNESRLEEAVTKSLMTALISKYDINMSEISWINPGEELVEPNDMENLIKTSLNQCSKKPADLEEQSDEDLEEPRPKLQKQEDNNVTHLGEKYPMDLGENIVPVEAMPFSDFYDEHCYHPINCPQSSKEDDVTDPIDIKSIVNCFVHPEVISCIVQKLKEVRFMSTYTKT